jgi:membrane fusion protein (multidrug efflux system)
MSADVLAVLSRTPNALTIPAAAIFVDGGETIVYVVGPDSTVVRTPLVLGTRLAAVVEVLEGVSAGQQVVQAGHQKLFPGAKVMPIVRGGTNGAPGGPGEAPGGAPIETATAADAPSGGEPDADASAGDEPTASAGPAAEDGTTP